ncbi:MAG: VCBS repeat-containing protein, partial [Alphaproteobacteria bacterium]|nr:VCBS repeat-containing protein [Alphaproteobacteria bacterium]
AQRLLLTVAVGVAVGLAGMAPVLADMDGSSDAEREASTGFKRSSPDNDEQPVEIISLDPTVRVVGLFKDAHGAVARISSRNADSFARVTLKNGRLGLRPLPGYRKNLMPRRPEMLSDGIVTQGTKDIAPAWLAVPTRRYGHGVLGDGIEASGLRARHRDGRHLSYSLSNASVFEDRSVRLADLNGDGRDELVVVRSYLDAGAALAVFGVGVDAGELTLIAETDAIGLPYRWLNPAGIADFDGDGRLEVAVVVTPHIGGILKIYELRGRRLVEEWSGKGFSNHAMGSRIQDMAAVVDWGKGPILLLPDAQRGAIREVYFDVSGYHMRALSGHDHPVVTAVVAADLDGDGFEEVLYGLGNGELHTIYWKRR